MTQKIRDGSSQPGPLQTRSQKRVFTSPQVYQNYIVYRKIMMVQ